MRINTLLNEKKELNSVNMSLANGFSNLEVFASIVLGKEGMRDLRDKNNDYDADLMISKYNEIVQQNSAVKENNEVLMQKLQNSAVVEEQYKQMKKKVEEWGGEKGVLQAFSKIKTLTLENESKANKIEELDQSISTISMDKGNELLQIMTNVEGGDDKSVQSLYQEISK